MSNRPIPLRDAVLAGGGEMGALMRSFDWAATPVGPVDAWPQSLRTVVSIVLASGYAYLVSWGPEFVQLYNDAYGPILGTKHPRALGQRTPDCWSEIWDNMIGPMFRQVRETAQEISGTDQLFLLERYGFVEECYFDFSYSPVRDETGDVGGVLVTCSETTRRVLSARRLKTLRDLGARALEATSTVQACQVAVETLGQNQGDVPFALLYLVDQDRSHARLTASGGLGAHRLARPQVQLIDGDLVHAPAPSAPATWPLGAVLRDGQPVVLDDLEQRFGSLLSSPWPEPVQRAVLLPVTRVGEERPSALLILGVSPRLMLDDAYRSFLDLVAGQVATALSNARAHEEEQRRAEALAELDRAKTVFFSNISHELRTPLTLLLGPLEDLLAQTSDPAAREHVDMAHRNALRLLRLVNTLLDFSRIEAGRIQASYVPTDLALLTQDLASAFTSVVQRAGLRLVVECPPLPQPVYVDRDMWEKIVLNLLSNAFKHTFVGEICVRLTWAGEQVQLEVHDTGVGIPAEELPHLFERFHRVQNARSRTNEGSGIGLALVRELVALHGGSVQVTSVVDQGSTFTVSVPTGTAHLPADRLGLLPAHTPTLTPASTRLGATPFVEESLRWLPLDGEVSGDRDKDRPLPLPAAPAAPAQPVGPRPQHAHILVAEDNADMRAYLRRLLAARYQVELTPDGEAAWAAAQARRPDLVLADLMMPRLDGFGLLTALRAAPETHSVPVILLSARAGEEARIEGFAAGADDYIDKPFSSRELLARVDAHLLLAQEREEVRRHELAARQAEERERASLQQLLMQAPAAICVMSGPDHVFTFANQAYCVAVGRQDQDLLGKPLRVVRPELAGQGYVELLDQVFATGQRYAAREARAQIARGPGGRLETAYFNFVVEPVRRAEGSVEGILVHSVEVTDLVQARQHAEQLAEERGDLLTREQAARTEAEAAVQVREEFLSIASHELRNPIAGLRGAAQLMRRAQDRGLLDTSRLDRYVTTIEQESARLATLTEDLLNVSRLQRGELPLRLRPTDMAALVHSAIGRYEATTGDGALPTFRVDLAPCVAVVDADRVDQIVANILDNAVKYSPQGGTIDVRLSRVGKVLQLCVQDQGIGLSPGSEKTIFEPFGRAPNATARQIPGLGLGLYICRRIAEQHGGRLWAESPGEGRGTALYLQLPADREPEPTYA